MRLTQRDSSREKVLVIVDMQFDFLFGGSLAVPKTQEDSDKLVSMIKDLMKSGGYDHIVFTQDSHPENHVSFASTHPGHEVFDEITTEAGLQQILWPDHCVKGTKGEEIHQDLLKQAQELLESKDITFEISKKGENKDFDSYSGVKDDNGTLTSFGETVVKNKAIDKEMEYNAVGLAFDYCVRFTASDLNEDAFLYVSILKDYTRSVEPENDRAIIIENEESGVTVIGFIDNDSI